MVAVVAVLWRMSWRAAGVRPRWIPLRRNKAVWMCCRVIRRRSLGEVFGVGHEGKWRLQRHLHGGGPGPAGGVPGLQQACSGDGWFLTCRRGLDRLVPPVWFRVPAGFSPRRRFLPLCPASRVPVTLFTQGKPGRVQNGGSHPLVRLDRNAAMWTRSSERVHCLGLWPPVK